MARPNAVFVCGSCGGETLKWQGQCPLCGAWNSLEQRSATRARSAAPAAAVSLAAAGARSDAAARFGSGHLELDRVLGGGVVPGSIVLLGGDPGIGKSTLLLAALDRLSKSGAALYVSGEESLRQTKMRADRLGVSSSKLHLFAETDANKVLAAAETMKPAALVVDSIQTMYLPELGSAPGS